jgi:hypothetical protein
MDEICGNCKFWELKDDHLLWGLCRRHPPKMMDFESLWPTTKDHDWCGEYEEE